MLTLLICVPLAGVIILPFIKGQRPPAFIALFLSLVTFALSWTLLDGFDPQAGGFQAVESIAILPALQVSYKLGIDGISLVMILLTTALFPLVILGSLRTIDKHASGYYLSLLLLETGVIGAFAALDLVLFYVFWEIMLVPMFFIIGIWGGQQRVYATIKFVLFTMIGSLLMLVAILYMGSQTGSFDYEVWLQNPPQGEAAYWLFGAFALAFLIKVPVFPLHTWLPDAHTEAPAGGSVILAGVLLKLGTYGLLRFNLPLFPAASMELATFMLILAVIGIIHGAMAAAVQPDMKRLIAYSSVSHMGFIVLGIFSFTAGGLEGSIVQMINHAISTGALFFLVGMIYDRTHTRMMADYGGMGKVIPVFAVLFLISTLASAGLPGLNGFIGEYVILVSAYQSQPLITLIAVSGVVLGAWYLLKLYGRVFFGPISTKLQHMPDDIHVREVLVIAPLIAMMFLFGLYPAPIFDLVSKSVELNVSNYIINTNENPDDQQSSTEASAAELKTQTGLEQGSKDTHHE
ncbi:MAG: NADH-quinone oxidoreductase subunit M [Leptospiraceae bacterium]|nr:NADH-quinone oxidoreductase subunit M [Leptospiraceae bacterium]